MEFSYYTILIFVILLLLIADILSARLIHKINHNNITSKYRIKFLQIYLYASIIFTVYVFIYPFIFGLPDIDGDRMRIYFTFFGIFFLLFIPKFIYQVFWFINRISKRNTNNIISKIGLTISSTLFILILYGMLWGKTDYKVKHVTLYSDNLQAEFNGLKLLQVSDIHLGSFYNKEKINKALSIINKQNADIVVFTGDLVNVNAYEGFEYIDMFKGIKAPLGKYSILGNHDMNDYRKIDKARGGLRNIQNVITINKAMGFDILLNENRNIIKGKDTIAMIGVMNWGKPPFKQYGNLAQAIKGTEKTKYKILLSHDPTHWEAEVLPKTNIDLTLSGHTHGFQIGINCCGIRWSPAGMFYSHWLGLYENNKRYLYVNAGLGFLGIPLRIGIRPEITVIELRSSLVH